jgi:hypothetical protein
MGTSEICGWIGSCSMLLGTYLIARKKSAGFMINFLSEGLWIARGVMSDLPDIVFVSCVFAILNFWGWWSWTREALRADIAAELACGLCYGKTVKVDKGDVYVYRCHSCRGEGPYHHKRDELENQEPMSMPGITKIPTTVIYGDRYTFQMEGDKIVAGPTIKCNPRTGEPV